MIKQKGIFFVIFFFMLLLIGCAKTDYQKAMEGKFSPEENQQIIISQCRDCHAHRDFDSKAHLEKITQLYKDPKFKDTKDCRVCHHTKRERFSRIVQPYRFFYHPKTIRPATKTK